MLLVALLLATDAATEECGGCIFGGPRRRVRAPKAEEPKRQSKDNAEADEASDYRSGNDDLLLRSTRVMFRGGCGGGRRGDEDGGSASCGGDRDDSDGVLISGHQCHVHSKARWHEVGGRASLYFEEETRPTGQGNLSIPPASTEEIKEVKRVEGWHDGGGVSAKRTD